MAHDPRLPTLEEVMNGNPFDIIDSPWGHIERWRASTLATGTMGALADVYSIVRADAAAAFARADDSQAQRTLIQHVLDQITGFEKRFDAHVARLAEDEDRARADKARKAKLDEEEIEFPPDISEKQTLAPPSKIEDNDEHHPAGDLHEVAAKDPDPDPEIEDDQGTLPNELLEGVPPASSTYPNQELPKPPVVSQPVAISLNEG